VIQRVVFNAGVHHLGISADRRGDVEAAIRIGGIGGQSADVEADLSW
jgi:hypothetical protein